eukprot:TRINITY_DN784_c0_g1_i3.p1 TRINITY_DN784_c0_g1~~TRINITY_DN784_c0_g1_i3.p1  ORF type:complete len:103 (+),score=2.83 TRINITY_DN784_c0_g1_i3:739-1047(+)
MNSWTSCDLIRTNKNCESNPWAPSSAFLALHAWSLEKSRDYKEMKHFQFLLDYAGDAYYRNAKGNQSQIFSPASIPSCLQRVCVLHNSGVIFQSECPVNHTH